MSEQKKQTFLQGAFILTLATVTVKIVGALFKLPLVSVLGNEGMAYFMAAYTIFNFLNSLAVSGLPVAVSKLVSEKLALGKYKDIKKLFSSTVLVFSVVGVFSSTIMFLFARQFANLVNLPGAYYSMVALSPAIFFVCIMSIYRGYYQGLHNMIPTAVSQVIEALGKLVLGLGLSFFVMKTGSEELINMGTLFGRTVENLQVGEQLLLQLGAAAAVLGVTLSTFCGTVYLWIKHKRAKADITPEMCMRAPRAQRRRVLIKSLIVIALPVALASVVSNLTSMIDLTSIGNRLSYAVGENAAVIQQMYPSAITLDTPLETIPTILYGAYSGVAITIFNLVPALTVTLGVSALPNVTERWARRDIEGTKRNIESILRITALITFPAGIGMSFLAKPILQLLFSDPAQVEIAAPSLALLGIAVLFVSLSIPINSVLQGVGKATVPVKLMLIGGTMKLIANYILVAIPEINIKGAPIGSVLCYSFIVVASLRALKKETKIGLNVVQMFLKPLLAAFCCGVTAKYMYAFILPLLSQKLATLLAIMLAALVYIVVLFLLRAIYKEDLEMVPGGEKLARKLFEKGLVKSARKEI